MGSGSSALKAALCNQQASPGKEYSPGLSSSDTRVQRLAQQQSYQFLPEESGSWKIDPDRIGKRRHGTDRESQPSSPGVSDVTPGSWRTMIPSIDNDEDMPNLEDRKSTAQGIDSIGELEFRRISIEKSEQDTYEKIELVVDVGGVGSLNPYDKDAIRLDAAFESPKGKRWGIPGFFMVSPGIFVLPPMILVYGVIRLARLTRSLR